MIKQLSIRNFKSVRELDLSCRRVNVFIGEPNTGKTNIVEAIGLRCGGSLLHAAEVFRASSLADLLHDQDTARQIEVGFDERRMIVRAEPDEVLGVHIQPSGGGHQAFRLGADLVAKPATFSLTDQGSVPEARYYLFANAAPAETLANGGLLPPFGGNLLHLL
jgi:recombinational DNA repair ATPase RecF